MSSGFSREIRKLEVRLKDYKESDQKFTNQVKDCIKTLRKLEKKRKEKEESTDFQESEKLSTLRKDALQSLAQVLKEEGHVEHQRSHILESYGTLIQHLEKS